MSDYTITLPDGTCVEAPTAVEAIGMAKAFNSPQEAVEDAIREQIEIAIEEQERRAARMK